MREIELKFQIPLQSMPRVARWVGGELLQLRASYVDTADRRLAQEGMALRMRLEGSRWVQTLKGELGDGVSRAEHEVEVMPLATAMAIAGTADSSAPPAVDPLRHRGTAIGERLMAQLASPGAQPLQCTYRTDIRRHRRGLRDRLGEVELALDRGWIEAPARGARLAVAELEVEWLRGDPVVVMAVADQVVARWGLWLDTRSKAERGDSLARGLEASPPFWHPALGSGSRPTHGPTHGPTQGPNLGGAVGLALTEAALRQTMVNASQLASGLATLEHVQAWLAGLAELDRAAGLARAADAAGAAAVWARQRPTGAGMAGRLAVGLPSVAAAGRRVRSVAYQRAQLAWLRACWRARANASPKV